MFFNKNFVYKKIIGNFSIVAISSLVSAIIAFCLQIMISNKLSLQDYGTFVYILTLVSIFLPIVCFGLPQLWVKSYGEVGEASKSYFFNSLKYILFFLPIIIIFLFSWSILNQFKSSELILLLILSIILISQIFFELNIAIYQIYENYIKLSAFQVYQNFFRLLFVFIFYVFFQNLNIYTVSFSYFLSAILIIFFGFIGLRNFLSNNKISYNYTASKNKNSLTLYKAAPIALINFMGMLYLTINVIILDFLGSKEDIAHFGIALNIFYVFLIIPNSIYGKLYLKKFHYWSNHDLKKLKHNFIIGILTMFLVGSFLVILIHLFSDFFILFFLDEKFMPSIKILNTLSFALPIIFAGYNAGTILLTKNYIFKKIINVSIATIFTPVFSYFLFFELGVIGIAMSIVLSSIILFMLNFVTLIKYEKHLQFY